MSRQSTKTSGRGKRMSVRPDYARRAEMEPLGETVWASHSVIIAHLEQPWIHQPILFLASAT